MVLTLTFLNITSKSTLIDDHLNSDRFKIVYTGSVRRVNNVMKIVRVSEEVQKLDQEIIFLIYGDGNQKDSLVKYCEDTSILNIFFKGNVEKKYIPFILSKSSLNFLHFEKNKLSQFGPSLNKLFEYFASGRPILSDCEFGYDIVQKYQSGFVIDDATPKQLAHQIVQIKNLNKVDYNKYCENATLAAKEFDFKVLTTKLINAIED